MAILTEGVWHWIEWVVAADGTMSVYIDGILRQRITKP